MKFRDIERFPQAYYQVNVHICEIENTLKQWDEPKMGNPLILNPYFQRGHVWTEKQQISFMEYFLKGGIAGRNIYFNCSSWGHQYNTPTYCVDGLQRLTAATRFVRDEIKVFGEYYSKYEDRPRVNDSTFIFHMLKLKSKKELLKVYLDHNSGGTPHNQKELDRVAKMIENTPVDETL